MTSRWFQVFHREQQPVSYWQALIGAIPSDVMRPVGWLFQHFSEVPMSASGWGWYIWDPTYESWLGHNPPVGATFAADTGQARQWFRVHRRAGPFVGWFLGDFVDAVNLAHEAWLPEQRVFVMHSTGQAISGLGRCAC